MLCNSCPMQWIVKAAISVCSDIQGINLLQDSVLLAAFSAPPSKNAVSAFQISCKLLFFYLGRFLKNLADDQWSSLTKGSISHIKHYVHTTFYHSSWLTRNLMFNGSIYYVLYLQILRFYLGRQTCVHRMHKNGMITFHFHVL